LGTFAATQFGEAQIIWREGAITIGAKSTGGSAPPPSSIFHVRNDVLDDTLCTVQVISFQDDIYTFRVAEYISMSAVEMRRLADETRAFPRNYTISAKSIVDIYSEEGLVSDRA
jgi:hypothetical protein